MWYEQSRVFHVIVNCVVTYNRFEVKIFKCLPKIWLIYFGFWIYKSLNVTSVIKQIYINRRFVLCRLFLRCKSHQFIIRREFALEKRDVLGFTENRVAKFVAGWHHRCDIWLLEAKWLCVFSVTSCIFHPDLEALRAENPDTPPFPKHSVITRRRFSDIPS